MKLNQNHWGKSIFETVSLYLDDKPLVLFGSMGPVERQYHSVAWQL